MAYTFKTIFETAREEAREKALQAIILIKSTDKSDAIIAEELKISEEFVKKVRQRWNKQV